MKKYLFLAVAAVLCGLAVAACSTDDEEVTEPKDPNEVTEPKEPEEDEEGDDDDDDKLVVRMLAKPNPIKLTAEQKVFVRANNQFTLNFLNTVNQADRSGKSFIYSPLSITYVLGMVNDAATGATEQELEQTLGFHEGGIQAVNEYCKNLIDNLPQVEEYVHLNIANAIFLHKNYQLQAQFQQDMQEYYNARAEVLDFSSSSTLNRINSWCNEKTNGMIPSILDEVNPDAVSYLLNAIYFKADWTSKFDKKNTKKETFTTPSGVIKLPLMHQKVLIYYAEAETYSIIEIPYGNGYWRMNVMLPKEGKTTDDVIHELIYGNTVLHFYEPYEVDLKLPRFDTTSDTNGIRGGLISLLKQMGIRRVFDANLAEIPNMSNRPVYIGMMRQKAAITVTEEGAEAAAVTVGGMFESSAGPVEEPPKATFHANRPFVYTISESSSGVILFVGKYTGL